MTVVVVGAGAAGLAAASRLRGRGVETLVLEAASSVGGRARTIVPALLNGDWLDEGAAWLHAAGRNPLVAMAREAGIALRPAFDGRDRQLFTDGRRATPAEREAYDLAWGGWAQSLRPAPGSDPSVAEAGASFVARDPWGPSVETWETTIIAAADADQLGLEDWRANALPDDDVMPRDGGIGALVARIFASEPISLGVTVVAIDRTPADHILVRTAAHGSVRASHVIVTVSTGVLRAGGIGFTPGLPEAHHAAVERLPMGLLSKIALARAAGVEDRLDVADGSEGQIERRVTRSGESVMTFQVWPRGAPHLIGYHGGRLAWSLAGRPFEADAFAREALAALYGADRINRLLAPGFHATDWGTDPLHRGAYAYAGPGDFGARHALGQPIDDARLQFAGEAVHHDGLAGTVGGAIETGWKAADRILEQQVHGGPVTG